MNRYGFNIFILRFKNKKVMDKFRTSSFLWFANVQFLIQFTIYKFLFTQFFSNFSFVHFVLAHKIKCVIFWQCPQKNHSILFGLSYLSWKLFSFVFHFCCLYFKNTNHNESTTKKKYWLVLLGSFVFFLSSLLFIDIEKNCITTVQFKDRVIITEKSNPDKTTK